MLSGTIPEDLTALIALQYATGCVQLLCAALLPEVTLPPVVCFAGRCPCTTTL